MTATLCYCSVKLNSYTIVSKGNPSPFALDDWTQIWQGWQGMECWHAFIIKKTEPTGGVLGADVEDQTCSHLRIQSWSAQNTSSSTICCVYINACVPWNIIMLFAGPFKTAALVNRQMLDHHSYNLVTILKAGWNPVTAWRNICIYICVICINIFFFGVLG